MNLQGQREGFFLYGGLIDRQVYSTTICSVKLYEVHYATNAQDAVPDLLNQLQNSLWNLNITGKLIAKKIYRRHRFYDTALYQQRRSRWILLKRPHTCHRIVLLQAPSFKLHCCTGQSVEYVKPAAAGFRHIRKASGSHEAA